MRFSSALGEYSSFGSISIRNVLAPRENVRKSVSCFVSQSFLRSKARAGEGGGSGGWSCGGSSCVTTLDPEEEEIK